MAKAVTTASSERISKAISTLQAKIFSSLFQYNESIVYVFFRNEFLLRIISSFFVGLQTI
ncbi:hypothetical protein D3C72_1260780 [compost metagenome]